jgi:hypothetical protein
VKKKGKRKEEFGREKKGCSQIHEADAGLERMCEAFELEGCIRLQELSVRKYLHLADIVRAQESGGKDTGLFELG